MTKSFDPLEVAEALELSKEMRRSSKARWEAVREKLTTEGIDPHDAAVGGIFPEDVQMESGILTTLGGRSFLFIIDCDQETGGLLGYDVTLLTDWKELHIKGPGAFAHVEALGRHVLQLENP